MLTGSDRAIVSPIAGTTRDAVDELITHNGQQLRFVDTAGIRRKGKTRLMAEKLSVVMARRHLEAADLSLLLLDATEGVTALDANIGGYAHESGRSVIIVVNKWDLVANWTRASPRTQPQRQSSLHHREPRPAHRQTPPIPTRSSTRPSSAATPQVPRLRSRRVFISAASGQGIEGLFQKIALVARERRKRVTTGEMNRFLARVDFQSAPLSLSTAASRSTTSPRPPSHRPPSSSSPTATSLSTSPSSASSPTSFRAAFGFHRNPTPLQNPPQK